MDALQLRADGLAHDIAKLSKRMRELPREGKQPVAVFPVVSGLGAKL